MQLERFDIHYTEVPGRYGNENLRGLRFGDIQQRQFTGTVGASHHSEDDLRRLLQSANAETNIPHRRHLFILACILLSTEAFTIRQDTLAEIFALSGRTGYAIGLSYTRAVKNGLSLKQIVEQIRNGKFITKKKTPAAEAAQAAPEAAALAEQPARSPQAAPDSELDSD